jgi:hypothetical protein
LAPEPCVEEVVWTLAGCRVDGTSMVHERAMEPEYNVASTSQPSQLCGCVGIIDEHIKLHTHLASIRWTNGFDFPGLGFASANVSMAEVKVAVKRHVCRSLGRIPNRCSNSGANEGVRSLSASSRTCNGKDTGQIGITVLTARRAKNLTRDISHSPLVLRIKSTIRPGVATTIWGRCPSSRA